MKITLTQKNQKDQMKEFLKVCIYLKSLKIKEKLRFSYYYSGTILREIISAAKTLSEEFGVDSDIWSVTSFNELRKDGMETERWNLLHPEEKSKKSFVQKCLESRDGPVIAASDYVRSFSDQLRPYVQKLFYSFGTDGYGRSDTKKI